MRVDVAVIGGGPAGTAAALTLRHYSNLRVALLERGDYSRPRIGETVGPGLQSLLAYLGLWEKFVAAGHRPAQGTAAAWGSDEIFRQEFFFTGRGEGWHLDRRRFDRMLADGVHETGGTILLNTAFRSIACGPRGDWEITGQRDNGQRVEIKARFVIDATGRATLVCRHLGARPKIVDRLVGITAFIDLPKSMGEETFALVETCRDGWWYSARLPRQGMAVAFMSDPEVVRKLKAHQACGWEALLASTRYTRARVAGASSPENLFSRPAGSQWLRPAGGPGWLAVGDAAAAFDPLSSMGIGQALTTGMHAARAAHGALEGDAELAKDYVRAVAQNFERFLQIRRNYYRVEQRWNGEPFWRRRHAEPARPIVSVLEQRETRLVGAIA